MQVVSTRLTDKLSVSSGYEATQQKSQGIPRLATACLVPVDLGSQGLVRVRAMWREGSAPEWHQSGSLGKKSPHLKATQLSQSLCLSDTPAASQDLPEKRLQHGRRLATARRLLCRVEV